MSEKMLTDFEDSNLKSDKTHHHGYQRFYPFFLEPLRAVPNMKMLELGYDDGYSVAIWQNYFNNPEIDSIDIIKNPEDGRLANFFNVNQDKIEELEDFVKNCNKKYRFIIDDASHIPKHQWNTFIRFFDLLEEGGIYIIEDTETNFWGRAWQYGYGFDSRVFSIYQKIGIINEHINSEFIEEDLQKKYGLSDLETKCLKQIEMMSLGQNCVIFVKKSKRFSKYYRQFKDYKQKKSVHLVDTSEKPLHQRIIRKLKKVLSKQQS